MEALVSTNLFFNKQKNFYRGKVRDVYNIQNRYLAMVACDRISAFDVVMPKPIPFKGQVLNQIAAHFLTLTKDIVPNWLISSPDPNVTIGHYCEPFDVEMVIRGYLAGHAWREYKSGKREICGVPMPDGLKENDKLPEPIITPTIKAKKGHDEDISREGILKMGLVSEEDYIVLENYTKQLFAFGSEYAQKQGLILVDTKYEFGKKDGVIMLMDEIHTPDSSRYFYADTYAEIQEKDQQQRQLSKEFVRQWLIENGFQGLEGQHIPVFTEEFVNMVTLRYIELFESITGQKFVSQDYSDITNRVEKSIIEALKELE
ncbi:MAG: phosphoribosylaminoimidazolesuccinocarboxamide synthase [Bacteroidia bacterium]|nr:phosphoribosylaminoimidazolesuccinocarboxamide synthase [Bacteroidia bacterium]MCF8425575.1 phosphoribosylaminoimidazolesuccinocarboxamide synthase [Bacteroidia bacterium]MCF8447142.1 phosphoribosylaminoimidazolesuccinocarboxamide synthase [Bacteroidia bacterium]